jgi:hypothetical protein
MRLLEYGSNGDIQLTRELYGDDIPPYAILSHTWGGDDDEVTYRDMINNLGTNKIGYNKIVFCAQQAKADGLDYSWVDTCCINKDSSTELTEAINSMFRWYRNAVKCYVYLADVSSTSSASTDVSFDNSRWFTRGWTLQELLAPQSVQFFTRDDILLGDKTTLGQEIAAITGIPHNVLHGNDFSAFDIDTRISWNEKRFTKREEDKAYSLLGILGVQMPLMYGEGYAHAMYRLEKKARKFQSANPKVKDSRNLHWVVAKSVNGLFTGRSVLLDRIQNALREDRAVKEGEQKRIVITGMGGQGKSEVCIKVANLVREE